MEEERVAAEERRLEANRQAELAQAALLAAEQKKREEVGWSIVACLLCVLISTIVPDVCPETP